MNDYVNKLSHAYIVSSPDSARREAVASRLAEMAVCSSTVGKPCGNCRDCIKAKKHIHPDIVLVERSVDDSGKIKQVIYVNQIRPILSDAQVLPNEASRKVYVINDAQQMNPSAQNALLRILEEPPPYVVFILCSPTAGALLDTVRSRCVEISGGTAHSAGEVESDVEREARSLAENYLSLLNSRDYSGLMRLCVSLEAYDAQTIARFLEAGRKLIADMLAGRTDDMGASGAVLISRAAFFSKCGEYLTFNVSVKHICGVLAAAEMR